MNKTISFFQIFHNGDLFVSKEYVRDVIHSLPQFKFKYYHNNHPKALLDIDATYAGSPDGLFDKRTPFGNINDEFFINTWLGVYNKKHINFDKLHAAWEQIYSELNRKYNVNLVLKDKHHYIGHINFEKFNLSNITNFISSNTNKLILISNGPAMSKQSFGDNMKNIIECLARKHLDIKFICTTKFETIVANILFTDDIIVDDQFHLEAAPEWGLKKCDLNEISYLSQHCDIIVGKNSGPFIFTLTKHNLLHNKKIFISLNTREEDSLAWNMKLLSEYRWSDDFNEQSILTLIEKAIND